MTLDTEGICSLGVCHRHIDTTDLRKSPLRTGQLFPSRVVAIHVRLFWQVAEDQAKARAKPLVVKKLYVLAGLMIENYHEHMKLTSRSKVKGKRGAEVRV